MRGFKNFSILISAILLIYFINCSASNIEDKNDKPEEKESSESSENEPNESDQGTISPTEMAKLEDEIIEFQEENAQKFNLNLTNTPEEIEKFLKEEEKEYGTKLPEKIEDGITDAGDFKNLVHYVELFDKINMENSVKEEELVEKSPEEMKKMKEELYELLTQLHKKHGLPSVSREEYNKIWNEKKEVYGKFFPLKIEQLIEFIKANEDIEEAVTPSKEISKFLTEASPLVTEPPREEPPKETFSVRNPKGKICMLAKFHSTITIVFPGKDSEQKVEVKVPSDAHAKGKCDGPNRSLKLAWEKFMLSLNFNKTSEDSWSAISVELMYDTSEPLFDGATNRGKVTAKSKNVNLFETPMGKSYFCPAQEVILLYHKNNQVATVRIKESHIQPYEVEDGKFSTNYRCNQVVLGDPDEEPFVPDETVPLAVGCTLALITLLILVGFSVHRAYNAAKVDYNSME